MRVEGLLAQVRLRVGDQTLTAIITRDAVEELKLRRGDEALAVIKATEVMVAGRPSPVAPQRRRSVVRCGRRSARAIFAATGFRVSVSIGSGSASDQFGHSSVVAGMFGRSSHRHRVVEGRGQDPGRRGRKRLVHPARPSDRRRAPRLVIRLTRARDLARALLVRREAEPFCAARSDPVHSPAMVGRSCVVTAASACSG